MPDISVFCPACGRATGPQEHAAGSLDRALSAIAYFAVAPAIVMLLVPAVRSRRLVRFHCLQSLMFSASVIVTAGVFRLLFLAFSVLPVVGFLVAWLLLGIGSLAILMLWLVLVVKAAQGQNFELPLIGPWAERIASGTLPAHADS